MYDFAQDHGPGNSYHGDATKRHYALGEVERVVGVPSHMVIVGDWLYIADTGNQRICRMDITSGTPGANHAGPEMVVEDRYYDNATIEDVVGAGNAYGYPAEGRTFGVQLTYQF